MATDPTATQTATKLKLDPPEVLQPVVPHEAAGLVPLKDAERTELEKKVDGFVDELSKTVVGGLGEAVGINYVSSADKATLIDHLAACGAQDYFERGIETAIEVEGMRVRPVDISQYSAVEVDFETDLARANSLFSLKDNTVADVG